VGYVCYIGLGRLCGLVLVACSIVDELDRQVRCYGWVRLVFLVGYVYGLGYRLGGLVCYVK
jgi:hypothetical protein